MRTLRIKFPNPDGHQLSARLELPVDKHPYAYALFAHCFTCNKNYHSVRHISRSLTGKGIAVLRFDFTGLGESEGEFADTNFSSNVDDLVCAARWLAKNHQPPSLLIGHSLGGAAVLFAARELDSVKAVVTIGTPAEPVHVSRLVKSERAQIEAEGKAEVAIGGESFVISKEFLDDLEANKSEQVVHQLQRALLILHSPQDRIVSVENAAKLYQYARHPKSYVSLDGADHLLSNEADACYAGDLIATWSTRYVPVPPPAQVDSDKEVAVRTEPGSFTSFVKAGRHHFIADEPQDIGGHDFGPTPYHLLTAALGACTGMTLRMYADRKGWPLQAVVVHLQHDKAHAEDCNKVEDAPCKVDRIDRQLELKGELTDAQRNRLLEIANRCPVHKTLLEGVEVNTLLKT
ncbi:putative redox protein [Catalinimonas alkaloidigena]|uniref:Putative redox protein n=1 Tax=Catalinimonas alkaloidigena TaxID=1075417 RepID=A0A1G8XQR7_9BACT|nr:bifunctional alpha/beta hydrolase/OsmC family protein [Catalinimonas alkaloidigena]SDJ92544.1 putative redox protein [Catalinimonas alkaloidigena]